MGFYKMSALDYVNKIENTICYKGEKFIDPSFYQLLDNVFKDRETDLHKGEILFRSRIYTKCDKRNKEKNTNIKGPFEGYNEVESFVNLNGIAQENRMNPKGVRYLYTSSDMFTSILEINPNYEDLISVAKIECQEDLKIVDLSKQISIANNNNESLISLVIQSRISEDNYDNYRFPQFIAQYCEYKGYDGLAYKSRYSNLDSAQIINIGRNITIFNYDKCRAISSKLYNCCRRFVQLKSVKEDEIVNNKMQIGVYK